MLDITVCQTVLKASIVLHPSSNKALDRPYYDHIQFYAGGNGGTEKLKNFPEATQLVTGRTRIQTVAGFRG